MSRASFAPGGATPENVAVARALRAEFPAFGPGGLADPAGRRPDPRTDPALRGSVRGDLGFTIKGGQSRIGESGIGVRDIDDCKAKLGHELSDCLWSILVLANKCGIDLEAEYARNTSELITHVSKELDT